uniref:uncharacterized protein LOC120337188 n=1 Tax=Styela clava TaxID=7725 RepID=UPI00193943D7|nr:uncharacterized protein LOC120337188 [Styela clava]
MATMKIVIILAIGVSLSCAQRCDIPPLFRVKAGAKFAIPTQVLTITFCPHYTITQPSQHECKISGGSVGWYPPINCAPIQPQKPRPQPQPFLTCDIPPIYYDYVRTTAARVGKRLTIRNCKYGPAYNGVHICTQIRAGTRWVPTIRCDPKFIASQRPPVVHRPIVVQRPIIRQPVVVPRPQPSNQIDIATLLLLQRLIGGDFDICDLFSFLDRCKTNSTNGSTRKKRFVELKELEANEKEEDNTGLASIFNW